MGANDLGGEAFPLPLVVFAFFSFTSLETRTFIFVDIFLGIYGHVCHCHMQRRIHYMYMKLLVEMAARCLLGGGRVTWQLSFLGEFNQCLTLSTGLFKPPFFCSLPRKDSVEALYETLIVATPLRTSL